MKAVLHERAEKAMEHEGDGDINCSWRTWNDLQRIGNGTRRLRNQKTSRDHPDNSISKIGQNTPGDLKRLAVTLTPVKNHLLTLM